MTDPAVEAARRFANQAPDDLVDFAVAGMLIATAREALKPIRAWFEWWNQAGENLPPQAWGELAPLIFTTEELER